MREEAQYDLVVFGATGFTGQRVLQYACNACSAGRVAAAGRSRNKLLAAARKAGCPESAVIAGVDVQQPHTLARMVKAARVVLNCVGPYRHFGEPVVKACVSHGVDCVDICGEPEFMERMHLLYDAQARSAGCFIISALGFDCVPAEVGAALCVRALQAQRVVPNRVDSYLSISPGPAGAGGHFATYESAVYGFNSAGKLGKLRAEARAAGLAKPLNVPGPKPRKPKAYTWSNTLRKWVLPFPGADASVVRRSMAARAVAGAPVAHYVAAFTLSSTFNLLRYLFFGGICSALASTAWGVPLLLRFPSVFTAGFFSHRGPTEAQMCGTSFQMLHRGFGMPHGSDSVSFVVAGPEPGYVATPVIMVEGALELMTARAQIIQSVGSGGVLTPGHALLMHGDGYIDRLRKGGFSISSVQ